MLIIPAIDLRGGRCVRLTQGDYGRERVYDADPADMAAQFESEGAKLLHVVDLDGAKQGVPANWDSLRAILLSVSIPVEFGGGVRTLEMAERVLAMGVDRVILGSKLVGDPIAAGRFFQSLGSKAVAGIDARNGKVAIQGWVETSDLDAAEFARHLEGLGACRFIVTDIARDGALTGPNTEFLETMMSVVEGRVIASGGVSSLEDISALRNLSRTNLEGVIVGKALYEGRFSLKDAVALTI